MAMVSLRRYTLYRSERDAWGIKGPNGWTGMLGMVARNEVDLAIGPFTVTYDRWRAFDMSVPVYIDQVEILVPVFEWRMSLFSILKIFSTEIWLLLLLAILVLCFVSSLVNKIGKRDYNFMGGFCGNLWIFGKISLQQGRVERSRTYKESFLFISWILSISVLVHAYSTTVLTDLFFRKSRKIDSIFDIIAAPDIHPVLEPDASIYYKFKESSSEEYKAVFKKVRENPKKCLLTYDKMRALGVEQVLSGHYAIITDSMRVKSFLAERYKKKLPCRFRLARERLWNLRKAMVFRKTFPKQWIQQINKILRSESGMLELRMRNEFLAYSECISNENVEIKSLELKHMLGKFIILIIGYAISSLVLIAEIICKKHWSVPQYSKKK